MPHQIPLAKNTSTNKYQELKVNSDGKLEVSDSVVNVNTDGVETKLDSVITNQTNGNQIVQVMGNTSADGSGTSNHIHTDANGNLRVSTVSTVNTAPANSVNSGITDDPANSVAVGLRARTTITDASTETFLKTDTDGHLQVDILSGGGGDASETTLSALNDKFTTGNDDTLSTATQILVYGKDAFSPFSLEPLRMSSDKLLTTNPNITRGEGNITGGGNGLQQILCYGKDQSGNLDPLNVDNNGHLKITVNDIESGIANALPVSSSQLPASLGQKANASSISICRSTTTGAFDLSARTTIGTASTSTKLLCDSEGKLEVNSENRTSGEMFASQTLSANSFTTSFDLSDYKQVHIFGQNTHATNIHQLLIYGSLTSSGTYYYLGSLNGTLAINNITENAISKNYYNLVLDNPPPFIKIRNNEGSDTTFELDFVGTKV